MDYTKIVKVLSLAATGNSIDAALDEMSKKELEYLLELCEEEKARRQAAKKDRKSTRLNSSHPSSSRMPSSA